MFSIVPGTLINTQQIVVIRPCTYLCDPVHRWQPRPCGWWEKLTDFGIVIFTHLKLNCKFNKELTFIMSSLLSGSLYINDSSKSGEVDIIPILLIGKLKLEMALCVLD